MSKSCLISFSRSLLSKIYHFMKVWRCRFELVIGIPSRLTFSFAFETGSRGVRYVSFQTFSDSFLFIIFDDFVVLILILGVSQ